MAAIPEPARSRAIRLRQPPDAETRQRLEPALSALPGVDAVRLEQDRVLLSYRFPAITLAEMLEVLYRIAGRAAVPRKVRWVCALQAFLEHNERDYRLLPRGPGRVLDAIYGADAARRRARRRDTRRQSWRDYTGRGLR